MYNMKFHKQLEDSRRAIFGNGGRSSFPGDELRPPETKIVPCHEGGNGEYVAETTKSDD